MATTTVVSWNIARRHEPWRQLATMDADVALLQEATPPPPDVAGVVDTGPPEHWDSHGWNSRRYEGRLDRLSDRWPMVVRLSDRVEVEWFWQVSPISETEEDEIAVSGIGTIAAARVIPRDAPPFIVASMYASWLKPHPSTGRRSARFSDGSTHRIISDLSAFIGSTDPGTHRILAAGDLNIVYGSTNPGYARPPETARSPTAWTRSASSCSGLATPPAGGPAPRRPASPPIRATCRRTTTAASRPRQPRSNSTTSSPRAASTSASRYAR